jgi:hypothetical protein
LAAPAASSASQALKTLQAIPAERAAEARATAEARLQLLIETYHRLAPLADPQTLAALAKQIGAAARALGDTAISANLPGTGSAPSTTSPSQAKPGTAGPDDSAKTVLAQAGAVLESIRRRLALAASVSHHAEGVKAALATVNAAAQDVAEALSAFGGSATPSPPSPTATASLNVLA